MTHQPSNPIEQSDTLNPTPGMPLTYANLRERLSNCADIEYHSLVFGTDLSVMEINLVWCDGVTDHKQINQFIIPKIHQMLLNHHWTEELEHNPLLAIEKIDASKGVHEAITKVFSGYLLICVPLQNVFYTLDISDAPNRTPEESSTEISIKGPKDGFTENITTNLGLIRKRLKTESLKIETRIIGRRSQTNIALLYLEDVANKKMIETVKQRLSKIDLDSVVSSNQLGEALGDSKYSLFPLLDYIGRPDYVVQALVRGRFSIIVDTVPMALIGPADLLFELKSPEDVHFPYFFVTFQRLLRVIGLIISIFIPGFWLALCAFNVEQLPLPLLATVTTARMGLPFTAAMELILMLGLFEIFREAGARLPKAVGQTVAVVGGLIVGDAAIRAGLGSPTMLVVAAVNAVATFTLVNQSLSGTVSILKFGVLLMSNYFGMFGFFISMLGILLYLSTLESFGISYLSPISPPSFRDMFKSIVAFPRSQNGKRPHYIHPMDETRQGDET
ncbi:spore germination protein [Paenibacillus sp. GCM10027629]|uniref:spore germination protein n=1 Tax=Paenibacillus sp. GCM10027629 TaxID=3273414 RepID=UPI0036454C55